MPVDSAWVLTVLVLAVFVANCQGQCRGGQLIRSGELSCAEKQAIVDKHNELRQQVATGNVTDQPPAVNMLQMGWDEELAKEAQRWADTCVFEHTPNRVLKGSAYGQNLALSMHYPVPDSLRDKPNFDSAVQDWFDEVYDGYDGTFNPSTGHYSQVVWSSSYRVGCGYSYYLKGGTRYTKYYVCNYAPAGNVLGVPAYRRGKPACTLPGSTKSADYPGLCKVKDSDRKAC